MKIRIAALFLVGAAAIAAMGCSMSPAHVDHAGPAAEDLKIDDLLTSTLALAPDAEVIVSRVLIPPHTTLPKHWHPGEEFVYVLQGSAVLWQKDKQDITLAKGDLLRIPLKQIHTATAGQDGATALVFRVHEKGKPARTLTE